MVLVGPGGDHPLFIGQFNGKGTDQGFGNLQIRGIQKEATGHVVALAVEVAVKDQTERIDLRGFFKGIFQIVALFADPKIFIHTVVSVAHDIGVAMRLLGKRRDLSFLPG